MGFEPTPSKWLVPKTSALDRSATLPDMMVFTWNILNLGIIVFGKLAQRVWNMLWERGNNHFAPMSLNLTSIKICLESTSYRFYEFIGVSILTKRGFSNDFMNSRLDMSRFVSWKFKIWITPGKGFEPLALRLKVWCSTDWANRAYWKAANCCIENLQFGTYFGSETKCEDIYHEYWRPI